MWLPLHQTFSEDVFITLFSVLKLVTCFPLCIACASMFPNSASDYGMIVANGTYAITASHCVQCSCGPGNLK